MDELEDVELSQGVIDRAHRKAHAETHTVVESEITDSVSEKLVYIYRLLVPYKTIRPCQETRFYLQFISAV